MLLILDRGFLYFAKFVGAIVLVILATATAYFGFDLNRAREDVESMRVEVQKAKTDVENAKKDSDATESDVKKLLADAKNKLTETQSLLDKMLSVVQRESTAIHQSFIVAFNLSNVAPKDAAIPLTEQRTWFTVPELAKLYNFPSEVDGTGQIIGLLRFHERRVSGQESDDPLPVLTFKPEGSAVRVAYAGANTRSDPSSTDSGAGSISP